MSKLGTSALASEEVSNQAYFVSPSGSDNNLGTPLSPFLTLERARDAMRSSEKKVTYLLSGTYKRSEALELGDEDSGETWSAAPKQTPMIDGSGKSDAAIEIKSDHISIHGISVSHFLKYGFIIRNSSDIVLENNFISDIRCSGWNQGGIVMFENISHVVISHNLIQDINYAGIFYANSTGGKLVDLRIEFNFINRTCSSVKDCGAIYADDRSYAASKVLIFNNTINEFGPESNWTKGIYLDDLLSNAVVRNNVILGTGTYAFQVLGGDHNIFEGNIADITRTQALGLYQWTGDMNRNFGMKGNTFRCNIVYSSAPLPEHLWVLKIPAGDDRLAIYDNIYWGSREAFSLSVTGDTTPRFLSPKVVNTEAKDFRSRFDLTLPRCKTIGR